MKQIVKRRRALWAGIITGIVVIGVGSFLFYDKFPGKQAGTASAKEGKLEIESQPAGATIFVDGKKISEKTNATIEVAAGERTLKLELQDYDTQEIKVTAQEGRTVPVEHIFTVGGQTVTQTGPGGPKADAIPDEQLATYTNNQYGYSIKHPKSWLVETDPSGVGHFYNENAAKVRANSPGAEVEESLTILGLPNPRRLPPKQWYEAREEYPLEDQSQIKKRDLTVNGQPAFEFETPYGFVPYLNTVLTRGEIAVLIQQRQGSPDRKIYDQLLQTFAFR